MSFVDKDLLALTRENESATKARKRNQQQTTDMLTNHHSDSPLELDRIPSRFSEQIALDVAEKIRRREPGAR